MKITWHTFKWFILAGLIPTIYYKIRFAVLGGYSAGFNVFSDLMLWIVISIVLTSSMAYLILSEVIWLEKKLPWKNHQVARILAELLITNVTVTVLMVGASFILYPLHGLMGIERTMSFDEHLFEEITMGIVMNMLLVSMAEGTFFFNQWKNSVLLSERLERENVQSQLEVLKSQVNPHFLFNSLNVLSSLVHADADKAEEFIDEFASVYRYILNIQGQTVVTLREELHFLDSYIFLQKIRFKDGLKMHLHIDAQQLGNCLPPLSLQMLVENAIKHNVVGKEKPLHIRIFTKGNALYIVNNLQVRQDEPSGTGMGLKNLRERYFRLAGLQPQFEIRDNEYVAQIPLFDDDQHVLLAPKESDSFKCHSFNRGIFKKYCPENRNKEKGRK